MQFVDRMATDICKEKGPSLGPEAVVEFVRVSIDFLDFAYESLFSRFPDEFIVQSLLAANLLL